MVTTFRLPDIHKDWPFKKIVNVHHDIIATESAEWIASFGVFDVQHQQKFNAINAGWLAALAYPYHDPQDFRAACDLMNILFAMDDVTDKLTCDEVKKLSDNVLAALRDPKLPRQENEHPLVDVHRSFSQRILTSSPPGITKIFHASYKQYVTAVASEAKDRETYKIRTSIEDYLDLRRSTGAIKPSFDLILLPLDVKVEALSDPRVKDMEIMAIDMVAVANDIVSFNVEQARGDIHNLAIVLMRANNLSVQESMNQVGDWYRKRIQDFIMLYEKCKSDQALVATGVCDYLWGLGTWVTANYEWSFGSSRFFGDKHQEIRITQTVTLLPKKVPGPADSVMIN